MVRSFAIRDVESDIVRHLKCQFDTEIGNLQVVTRDYVVIWHACFSSINGYQESLAGLA